MKFFVACKVFLPIRKYVFPILRGNSLMPYPKEINTPALLFYRGEVKTYGLTFSVLIHKKN